MKYSLTAILFGLVTTYSSPVFAQDVLSDLLNALPKNVAVDMDAAAFTDDEIIAKLNEIVRATQVREILPVEDTVVVNEQFLFLETLKFEDGSVLELTAGDYDRIFLMAKEVRLNGPNLKATVRFTDRASINGAVGAAPSGPPAQIGGRSGSPAAGTNGANGRPGGPGMKRKLPTLWIVADDLQIRKLPSAPFAFPDVRIELDGVNGGEGGTGGEGQRGGKGQNGRHGSMGFPGCNRSAKRGGNGGRGGNFGPGGIGANGGDGGNVLFVVSSEFAEHVKDMRMPARGGLPGRGGLNGKPGSGGSQGARGSKPGTCGVTGSSRNGHAGSAAPHNSRAVEGAEEGSRGRIRFVLYEEVADLFEVQP